MNFKILKQNPIMVSDIYDTWFYIRVTLITDLFTVLRFLYRAQLANTLGVVSKDKTDLLILVHNIYNNLVL